MTSSASAFGSAADMPARENRGPASQQALLAKVREAKRLADAARWQLLDVVVWLNEVEDDAANSGEQHDSEPRSGLLGVGDHYADYDEYQADDREGGDLW